MSDSFSENPSAGSVKHTNPHCHSTHGRWMTSDLCQLRSQPLNKALFLRSFRARTAVAMRSSSSFITATLNARPQTWKLIVSLLLQRGKDNQSLSRPLIKACCQRWLCSGCRGLSAYRRALPRTKMAVCARSWTTYRERKTHFRGN